MAGTPLAMPDSSSPLQLSRSLSANRLISLMSSLQSRANSGEPAAPMPASILCASVASTDAAVYTSRSWQESNFSSTASTSANPKADTRGQMAGGENMMRCARRATTSLSSPSPSCTNRATVSSTSPWIAGARGGSRKLSIRPLMRSAGRLPSECPGRVSRSRSSEAARRSNLVLGQHESCHRSSLASQAVSAVTSGGLLESSGDTASR
mmetsp:Transcript_65965/g.175392  ORF Transcript_65965/g.175392 Transcript_65965/m.175392 type:complete len:209 (-) Transcript_65965:265-891(-)